MANMAYRARRYRYLCLFFPEMNPDLFYFAKLLDLTLRQVAEPERDAGEVYLAVLAVFVDEDEKVSRIYSRRTIR